MVPAAPALVRERFGIPAGELVVLFLSRLHPKKGLHFLIDALGALSAQRFHLVVAGSGDACYEASIKDQVVARGLRERVHFAGFAERDFKQLLLQGADLFVLPSHP